MLPTLIIEASDGTTKATLECTTAEATFTRRGMDRATATVDEADYAAVTIDPIADRLFIDRPDGTRLFGGRFDDDERDGATIRVTLASFRRDAIDAEPTGRSLTFQNVSDKTVVEDAISNVPTLSTGAIEELATALSFEFPNSSRAKQIRKAAVATGAAVRYNPDRTVDYQDRLGSDLSLTLSPANQNIVGDVTVEEDVRDRVTHVRAFGSRELNLSADGVTASYTSGRQVWREFEDTDIRSSDRLQQIADRLATEYDGEPRKLTVSATVVGEDLQRGDTVTVRLPDRDIDRTMTVTELREQFKIRGRELVATLTNRQVDEDAQPSGRESLQRFNRGYQGFVDRNQTTSGWNPAGDGTPQTLEIVAYPDDIVSEERVDLQVQGRAWRSPVDITGHSHNVNVTHPSHNHSISTTSANSSSPTSLSFPNNNGGTTNIGSASSTDVDTYQVSSETFLVAAALNLRNITGSTASLTISLDDNTTGETGFIDTNPVELVDDETVVVTGIVPGDRNGDTLAWDVFNAGGSAADVDFEATYTEMGTHSHSVSDTTTAALGTTETSTSDATNNGTAEIIQSFGGKTYYPRDVEISVNSSLVTTLSGNANSGFSAVVDLSGELSAGQNTIEAEPTSERGSINLNLATELFRKGP